MKRNVIVGLGNPGEEYAMTYHNAGILALETIAKALKENGKTISFKTHAGLFRYAAAGGLALVVPLTFMNESGKAVKEAMKKFGAAPADLTVLHDESDLTLGQYKIVSGGGSAGHKGIQSVIEALGTPDFRRVRIGIRDPREQKRKKAGTFVLGAVSPDDERTLDAVFSRIMQDLAL